MPTRTRLPAERGDFQTPLALARDVCRLLARRGVAPAAVLEPTCGRGAFLRATREVFPGAGPVLGVELDPEHAHAARSVPGARVEVGDFFARDWDSTLSALPEPLLVLGNPPWVTNSAVGALMGSNLPQKSNFQRLPGIDAITGKSNFDISEWMLIHLLERLSGRRAVLAMLCKSVVARKVLVHAWTREHEVASAATFSIDAARRFGAAVDACLLVCELAPGGRTRECAVHEALDTDAPASTLALREGRLVADLDAFSAAGHLAGTSPMRWRSGVKHDCARVMELRPRGGDLFENGLGESVRLESTFLFPMLKSSELVKPEPRPSRRMLVTQRIVGEDTARVEREAPLTWGYLETHAERLARRASSIYRERPRFSVFGVGPYTFAPWKVAVSGFYAQLAFRCVGPVDGAPVVFDDTAYFLPCRTEEDARALAHLLESRAARRFFQAFLFRDTKRPVTAQLLSSLDLGRLARELGRDLPIWTDVAPFESAS